MRLSSEGGSSASKLGDVHSATSDVSAPSDSHYKEPPDRADFVLSEEQIIILHRPQRTNYGRLGR
jgi:hypothetical protein